MSGGEGEPGSFSINPNPIVLYVKLMEPLLVFVSDFDLRLLNGTRKLDGIHQKILNNLTDPPLVTVDGVKIDRHDELYPACLQSFLEGRGYISCYLKGGNMLKSSNYHSDLRQS